jgi:hypothetical protein
MTLKYYSCRQSVYKFSYFLFREDGSPINALLTQALSPGEQTTAFSVPVFGSAGELYGSKLYSGDLAALIPFQRLQGIVLPAPVSDVAAIEAALSAFYPLDTVKVHGTEMYWDPKSHHQYNVLLFSLIQTFESQELWPVDISLVPRYTDLGLGDGLPPVPRARRSAHGDGPAPLPALEDLLRLRLARHVFLDQYVVRGDLGRVLSVIGSRHQDFSDLTNLQAQYGGRQWYITSTGEQVSSCFSWFFPFILTYHTNKGKVGINENK